MYELTGVTKSYTPEPSTPSTRSRTSTSPSPTAQLVAIQGPTGGGKSTLLQMLGALDRPTTGRVDARRRRRSPKPDDRRLGELRAKRDRLRLPGFNLIPTLTAQENVETALVPLGLAGAERTVARQRGARSVGPRRPPRPPAGRALRRSAAARRHRPRARQAAEGAARRRAHRQPRRVDARRDHGPARGPLARPRADAHHRHARLRGRPAIAAPAADQERSRHRALTPPPTFRRHVHEISCTWSRNVGISTGSYSCHQGGSSPALPRAARLARLPAISANPECALGHCCHAVTRP